MMPRPTRLLRGCWPPLLLLLAVTGCNMTAGMVGNPRTPVEQLLLTQALLRSLDDAALPLRPGDSVTIETASLPTHLNFEGDRAYAEAVITSWFARHGAVLGRAYPAYRVRILLHAFGVEKTDVFIGIPPIQSLLLPMALPELTLYRKLTDRGYARLSLDIIEERSGRAVASPPPVEALVQFSQYTLLFLFAWNSTDLIPPPL
jgi:hypothetical protein